MAALSEREYEALEQAVPALDGKRSDAAIATTLTAWCGERKVQDAFQVLDGAGVPCEVSDPTFSQRLYDDPNSLTSDLRGVHGAVGAGLIGFFGVQSVTGMWNLLEARSAPGHR